MSGYVPACLFCNESREVRKHGKGRTGCQRYYCRTCQKTFQSKYIYNVKTSAALALR